MRALPVSTTKPRALRSKRGGREMVEGNTGRVKVREGGDIGGVLEGARREEEETDLAGREIREGSTGLISVEMLSVRRPRTSLFSALVELFAADTGDAGVLRGTEGDGGGDESSVSSKFGEDSEWYRLCSLLLLSLRSMEVGARERAGREPVRAPRVAGGEL